MFSIKWIRRRLERDLKSDASRATFKVAGCLATALALVVTSGIGHAEDNLIYYGSRVGMHLTIVSKTGIGSDHAVIGVLHTPADAKAFCVEYARDNSLACVKSMMAEVQVKGSVSGNCVKRSWTDMHGESFVFLGRNIKAEAGMAEYLIKNVRTGEILDGSSVSGYGVELPIFQRLCPGNAK